MASSGSDASVAIFFSGALALLFAASLPVMTRVETDRYARALRLTSESLIDSEVAWW